MAPLQLRLELGKKKKKKKKPLLDVTTGDVKPATEQQAPPPPAPSSVSDATPPTNTEPIQQEGTLSTPKKNMPIQRVFLPPPLRYDDKTS